MKQETPEEAAENLYPMVGNEYLWHIPIQRREGFIAGAKWQQEKSRQNHLMMDEIGQFKFSKPKMYNEEDMMDYSNYRLLIKKALSPKEWFEQFKKEKGL